MCIACASTWERRTPTTVSNKMLMRKKITMPNMTWAIISNIRQGYITQKCVTIVKYAILVTLQYWKRVLCAR